MILVSLLTKLFIDASCYVVAKIIMIFILLIIIYNRVRDVSIVITSYPLRRWRHVNSSYKAIVLREICVYISIVKYLASTIIQDRNVSMLRSVNSRMIL